MIKRAVWEGKNKILSKHEIVVGEGNNENEENIVKKNKKEQSCEKIDTTCDVEKKVVIEASCVEELPKEVKDEMENAEIKREDAEKNFETLLKVMSFCLKKKFALIEELKEWEKAMAEEERCKRRAVLKAKFLSERDILAHELAIAHSELAITDSATKIGGTGHKKKKRRRKKKPSLEVSLGFTNNVNNGNDGADSQKKLIDRVSSISSISSDSPSHEELPTPPIQISRVLSGKKAPEVIRDIISPYEDVDPGLAFEVKTMKGKGGFGAVFRALPKDTMRGLYRGQQGIHLPDIRLLIPLLVAVKIMPHKTERQIRSNASEVSFLKAIGHPNIVGFFSAHLVGGDEMWVFTEFLDGGMFSDAVRTGVFTPSSESASKNAIGAIAYVSRAILRALDFLHKGNLIHRDVKSGNVMLSRTGEVKLIDFGLCIDAAEGASISLAGSAHYMAPEMILRQVYDCKVDIWGVGIMAVESFNGIVPNKSSRSRAMFSTATRGCPDPIDRDNRGRKYPNFVNFLDCSLKHDPNERSYAEELLQHPFLDQAVATSIMSDLISKMLKDQDEAIRKRKSRKKMKEKKKSLNK